MRLFLLLSFLLAFPAQARSGPDPISRLVGQLEGSGGLWVNGVSPWLEYPNSVEPEILVGKILEGYDWAKGRPFQILEQREVQIDTQPYLALLVQTAAGPKVILLQYQPDHQWWSKVLDAP